jgi:hypothetical protein
MSEFTGTAEAAKTVSRKRGATWIDRLTTFREWLWPKLLGLFLLALGIVLFSAVIALWPAVLEATRTTSTDTTEITWFDYTYSLTPDAALLLLVVLVSALGSFVHAATSFSDYMGNGRLRKSWIWWYLLRVFVGSGLALLFYFAIRGGFFGETSSTDINPYGIAAISGLVGLFSKQATDKLRELFDTAFHVRAGYGDDARRDGMVNPEPVLVGAERIDGAGDGNVFVELAGKGFMSESVVQVRRLDTGDTKLVTPDKGRSETRLRVRLTAEDVGSGAAIGLAVVNPEPGGGVSQQLTVDLSATDGET